MQATTAASSTQLVTHISTISKGTQLGLAQLERGKMLTLTATDLRNYLLPFLENRQISLVEKKTALQKYMQVRIRISQRMDSNLI